MPTKRERLNEFQKQYNALGFNDYLLGDEVIVTVNKNEKIEVRYRKQTSADESQIFTFQFDSQSQCERLLPAIMKGVTRDHR